MVIRILATTRRCNFISWAIRTIQGTAYSHFGIEVKGVVLESTGVGVHLTRLPDFRKHNQIIKVWELDLDIYPEVLYEWMASVIGTKYGYLQNFGYLLMALKILKKNPWGRNSERIVCSEVVALFIKKFANVKIGDSDKYDLVETEKLIQRTYYANRTR